MKKIYRVFLLLVSLVPAICQAQMDNTAFEEHYQLPDTVQYGIQAHAFSFFRNLEYFTPAADGKTLFGQQLAVRGLLRPTDNITVSGGIYLWRDFGNNTLQSVRPLYTFRYQKKYFSFLFGTLEGQLSHRQIEPLQDFESVITRRQEEGFQLKYDAPKFWLDVWLEWQNMIYRYSTEQERLQIGITARPTLSEDSVAKIVGILQTRVFHQGGQLDTTISKAPGTTFWVVSPGLRVEKVFNSGRQLTVDVYVVKTGSITSTYPEGVRSGIGANVNIQLRTKALTTMLSYWEGNNIYIPGGGQMYSSLAQEVGAQSQRRILGNRQILILRFMRDVNLGSNCVLSARIEPQFDFNLQRIDYNYQLYINYQPKWGWSKKKDESYSSIWGNQ
jgi:hypothetical protein